MRIVIVTPDTRIDRRILQQAEALFTQGHEVIILAEWREGMPLHERLGNIKVEHLLFWDNPDHPLPDKAILYLQRKGIGFLNLISRAFQKLLALIARVFQLFMTLGAIVVNKSASLTLHLFQKLRGLRRHEQIMLNRVIYYDPDVVQVHDLPYLRVGIKAKKQLNVPLVYDARELYPEIGTLSPKDKKWLTRVEAQALPNCDQVITVNSFIAEEMSQRYHVPRPAVIHNAIPRPPGFIPTLAENRFRTCFSIPAEDQILLYQGWMSLDRGLQNLVQAMARVPAFIHLVLMGYGEEAKQELEKIAKAEGITGRIHFKETVSHQDLLFWTASADAGIIPYPPVDLNNYYCSPGKLFEFIQAGLPVIANDLPFLRQIVAEEGFGVVIPLTDVPSYVQAICTMFDPELGGPNRFRPNLLEKAGKYDWSIEKAKLLDLYAKLDSHSRNGKPH